MGASPVLVPPASGSVTAVALHPEHAFAKTVCDEIELVAGMGVRGDAHYGAAVKHRSRVAKDPSRPNLRQVHLIHGELYDELRERGFGVGPGQLGENVTTRGVDLLSLPVGSVLRIGSAILAVTGLRNPCRQLDDVQDGLMRALLERAPDGSLIRKGGVMAVVVASGAARPGDAIDVARPPPPFRPMDVV
jgi:hypothetical protein